jgi:hypothetical protein
MAVALFMERLGLCETTWCLVAKDLGWLVLTTHGHRLQPFDRKSNGTVERLSSIVQNPVAPVAASDSAQADRTSTQDGA